MLAVHYRTMSCKRLLQHYRKILFKLQQRLGLTHRSSRLSILIEGFDMPVC
jgi:hypothetical protein